jgi:hypothetical protein
MQYRQHHDQRCQRIGDQLRGRVVPGRGAEQDLGAVPGRGRLRTSIHNLTHISVNKGAASEIKSDLEEVQANLTTLTTQTKGEWQPQTTDLKTALANLQTATSDLASSPSASTVSGVVTALGGVTTAASSLDAVISTKCPSASPS